MTTTFGGPRGTVDKVSISAAAMRGTATAGAGDSNGLAQRRAEALGANMVYLAFDPTTEENAYFQWSPPDDWDKGPITFLAKWIIEAEDVAGGVVWGLKCLLNYDGAEAGAGYGTEVTVTDSSDSGTLNNEALLSPESSPVTPFNNSVPGGSRVNTPVLYFNIARKATAAGDTLTVDAQLLEIEIRFNRGFQNVGRSPTRSKVSFSAAELRGTAATGAGDSNGLPERGIATNTDSYDYLAFDQTTEENAYWQWSPPDDWDKGPLTFCLKWLVASGIDETGSVIWGVKCLAVGDGAAIGQAYGTEITVTSGPANLTGDTTNISPESGNVTSGGSVQGVGTILFFNIARKAGDAGDTLPADARLLEVEVYFNRNFAR